MGEIEYSKTGKPITEVDYALDNIVTGLVIVTTMDEGIPYGMTVAWFSRTSNEPYSIIVSLSKNSNTYSHVNKSKNFAINIIEDKQKELADFFGKNSSKVIKKFDEVPYGIWKSGAPILIEHACTAIDCRVVDQMDAGNHTIFLGEVLQGKRLSNCSPYVYCRRDFI